MDKLELVNRVIKEHRVIKGHVKFLGDTVTDREALNLLLETNRAQVRRRLGDLPARRRNLEQTLALLDEGLQRHFAFEVDVFPGLMSEPILEAIALDHRRITGAIGRTKDIVGTVRLDGLTSSDAAVEEARLRSAISELDKLIMRHTVEEEVILAMIRRALEAHEHEGESWGSP